MSLLFVSGFAIVALPRQLHSHRAGRCANHKPLRRAHHAPQHRTAARGLQGGVAFPAERLRLGLFILEVCLGRGQLRLALPAAHGKVIERLQVFGGQLQLGVRGLDGLLGASWMAGTPAPSVWVGRVRGVGSGRTSGKAFTICAGLWTVAFFSFS